MPVQPQLGHVQHGLQLFATLSISMNGHENADSIYFQVTNKV